MNDIVPVPEQEIDLVSRVNRENMASSIRGILDDLKQSGNERRAVEALKSLDRFADVSVFGRAQLLAGIQKWYKDSGKGDFYKSMGLTTRHKQVYAERLIGLWQCVEEKKIPKSMQKRSIYELLPISMHINQGFEIDEEGWAELMATTDVYDVQDVLRSMKGKPPRKSTLELRVSDDGTITAWYQDKPHYVGYLNLEHEDKDEIIKKSIARIVDNSHIKRNRE